MKFKEWLNSELLLEFRASNLYDFYALELASKDMNSREVDHLLVDRGNLVYSGIMSAVGFVLFLRFGKIFRHCIGLSASRLKPDDFVLSLSDFPVEFQGRVGKYMEMFEKIKTRSRQGWANAVRDNSEAHDIWVGMNVNDQKELVYLSRQSLVSRSDVCNVGSVRSSLTDRWTSIYNFYQDNANDDVITNPETIKSMINRLTQLVHNSGNLLEYLPSALDIAIHVRDTANMAQLLYGASPTVKELLRSASLPSGGLTEQLPPSMPKLVLTAMSRNMEGTRINHIELVGSTKNGRRELITYRMHTSLGETGDRRGNCTFNVIAESRKSKDVDDDFYSVELDYGNIDNIVLSRMTKSDWKSFQYYAEINHQSKTFYKPIFPTGQYFDLMQFGKAILNQTNIIAYELSQVYKNLLKYVPSYKPIY